MIESMTPSMYIKQDFSAEIAACVPCNTNKSSMPLEGWRKMLTHYRDVQLLRDSTHARHLLRFGLIEIKSKPVTFFFETYKPCNHEHSDWEKLEPEPNLRFRCVDCGEEI